MKWCNPWGVSLAALAGIVSGSSAQVGLPAPPTPAAGVGAPAALTPAAPAARPPANLWSFLCPSPEQKAACRDHLCNSALGQLLNNSLRPASALTGGLIPSLCPPVTAAALAQPATSPEGAAARIKQDEAAAKARRADVRYLGTVDCSYWPEAERALINALRFDRNECVRLEAALALGRGCCCNRATLLALTWTVSGRPEDGGPVETSERVKWAAAGALEHCLACFVEVQPAPPPQTPPETDPKPDPDREKPPPGSPAAARNPAGYYSRAQQVPLPQVLQRARQALQQASVALPGPALATPSASRPQGLVNLVLDRVSDRRAPRDAGGPPPLAGGPEDGKTAPPPAESPARRGLLSALRDAMPERRGPEPTAPPHAPAPGPSAPEAPAPTPPGYPPQPPRPSAGPPPGNAPTVGYGRPATTPWRVSFTPSEAPAPQAGEGDVAPLLVRLRRGAHPPEREEVANQLARLGGRPDPRVVTALMTSAGDDSAPGVRAACLRALVALKAEDISLVALAARAQDDPDPAVRAAAGQMNDWLLAGLGPLTPGGR